VQYGQKQWKSSGAPVILEQEQSTFLTIRLPRYGSISGTIVDENDVGLPEHEVFAYRNTRPPRVAARGQSDDRGVYRIWGLEPGAYLVRTAGKEYEEGGYLPTFHRETLRVEEAQTVEVNIDQQTDDIKVRPFPGRLFTVSGTVPPIYPPAPVTVTLVTDTGRESITSASFRFPPRGPGPIELFAETAGDRRNPPYGAYQSLALDRDRTDIILSLRPLPELAFGFESAQGAPIDGSAVKLVARRKDLAGEAPAETLRIVNGRAALMPGRWELAVVPSPAFCVLDFRGPRSERPENGRPDGWNEITVTGSGNVKFVLSSKPGALHGMVTAAAHEAVLGAPVFLEGYDPASKKRLIDLRVTRTDMRGQYQFYGLAPGTYRLASSFEYQTPDTAAIDTMSALTVKVEEARDQQQDLDLFVIR
jgi:hypothetical protein